MVAEIRAVRADLAARAKFAKNGERITDTRGELAELFDERPTAEITASKLALAHSSGLVEVG